MALFFREFVRPALVAFLIAFPLANYFIQQYLEAFAYRVPVTALTFLSIAIGALMEQPSQLDVARVLTFGIRDLGPLCVVFCVPTDSLAQAGLICQAVDF